MNDVFQDIFLVVLVFSLPIIVSSIYSVSLKKVPDLECTTLVCGSLICLIELFMTCWYGNEVTLNVSIELLFFLGD